jgi:TolB-like protein/DNA-binding winged helix-turn-helix (wHTH) protein
LGPFQLLAEPRALLRDGQPVPIAPRAIEVLAALAARPNEILTKEGLMHAVWPDTFVDEANLTVYIAMLRKLFVSAPAALQIETIPKLGYRLVGDIRAVESAPLAESAAIPVRLIPGSGGADLDESSSPRAAERIHQGSGARVRMVHHPLRGQALGGIALTLVLLIIAGSAIERWAGHAHGGVEAGGARIHSLAVLPLQNLSGDPAQDYFAAGITDQLTTELAHIHGLRVVSRTSASQFQAANRSLPDIARALGVEGVMEGSVVRVGNRVRVTTQLIESKNDRHIWAGTYEGTMDEIIALQDRVARDVAREVRAAVKPESAPLPASAQSTATGVNAQAYDDYLRGLYIWNRRDARTFDKAIEYLSRASVEDPHFAPSFASLADLYVLYALYGGSVERFSSLARQAALQALALDGNSGEAHTALGAVSAVFEWDWATAGREFQRAIDLNPNYATAHQWYADFYLIPQLRLEDAASEMDTAAALDPLSPIMLVDKGWVDYLRGDYPQARQQYDLALAMDADFIPAIFRMQEWYLVQGNGAEYAQTAAKLAGLIDRPTRENEAQAIVDGFAREGIRGVARAQMEVDRSGGNPRWDLSVSAAERYALLGGSASTCVALRGALRQRDTALLYLNVDPKYAVVRASPCYAEVAKQMDLPQLPLPSSAASTSAGLSSPASHLQPAK